MDIPGNPTVYATNFYNDFSMNISTIYQTSLLYWKHLTNPNRTDIYRAIVKPFYTTSNTLSATAGASNRKIIYSGNQWKRVFISNKQLYYSYSADDGINWDGYDVVSDTFDLSDISNPSLTAYGDTLHAIFTAEERQIYYARKVGSQNWQAPKLIYTAPQTIFGIASAVDALRKGHVTWIEDNGMLLGVQVMKHGSFNVHSANPAMSGISTVQNGYGMMNPGMDYDLTGTPHVVWQQNDEVYYKYKTGSSSWSSLLNISNSPSAASSYPAIELIYTSPHVVRQESVGRNDEIFYRYKGSAWSSAVNVSQTDDMSKHPGVISTMNGPMIVWADHHYILGSPAGSYIRYFISDLNESGVIEGQSYIISNHPALGIRPLQYGGNRVIIQWSDQFVEHLNQAPYKIGSKYFEMGISPMFGKSSSYLSGVPDDYTLFPNHPNPFNPNTQITFGLPADTRVGITVYDILGRVVIILADREYKAGYHSVQWNGIDNRGKRVSSGVYIYRMMTKDKSICKKMLLVK